MTFRMNAQTNPFYVAAAVVSKANPEMTAAAIADLLGAETKTDRHAVDLGFWKVSKDIGRTKQYV